MRFILKVVTATIGLSLLSTSFAGSKTTPAYKQEVPPSAWWSPSRIYMGVDGGYGVVSGAYKNDGEVTFSRLTWGLQAYEYREFLFGAELSVQSGNTMRLETNSTVSSTLGGLQPQAILKPFFDLLVTVKHQVVKTIPLFALLKGGIAYQQLQLENSNSTSDTVRTVNGEWQVGLGYNLTEHAMFTAFYQGIYSANSADVSVDASGSNTYIHRIPTQQAGFLGIEYSL